MPPVYSIDHQAVLEDHEQNGKPSFKIKVFNALCLVELRDVIFSLHSIALEKDLLKKSPFGKIYGMVCHVVVCWFGLTRHFNAVLSSSVNPTGIVAALRKV
ncbi:MAG: hypothetical protein GY699_26915 [Desulfobacteraceae bacterium]|nr:hypothetical protein [Desulfobacteraceae bacterium]